MVPRAFVAMRRGLPFVTLSLENCSQHVSRQATVGNHTGVRVCFDILGRCSQCVFGRRWRPNLHSPQPIQPLPLAMRGQVSASEARFWKAWHPKGGQNTVLLPTPR